jgi:hypothetical protein
MGSKDEVTKRVSDNQERLYVMEKVSQSGLRTRTARRDGGRLSPWMISGLAERIP